MRGEIRLGHLSAALLALAALVGSSVHGQPDAGGGPPPALVRAGEVRKEQVQDQWPVVGRLQEVRRAIIAAEQSGRIVAMQAEEGDVVVGGQTVLARVDEVWARLALRSAQANLAQAHARVEEETAAVEQTTRDLQALEELLAANSAKPKEVQDARTRLAAAAARLENARAQVQAAESEQARCQEDIERLAVVAPFDGVVVRKLTEIGQWVTPGTSVAEIISVGQIDALIDVPERLVNFLRRDERVEVMVESLKLEISGTVAAINPMGNIAARTFPVKVRLTDEEGQLKPAMSVVARVPTGERSEQLTVPRDAVHRQPTGAIVWANLDGKAIPVGVRVLFGVGDRYAVAPIGGGPPLAEGMQVVVEGGEALFPTRPLLIKTSAAATK